MTYIYGSRKFLPLFAFLALIVAGIGVAQQPPSEQAPANVAGNWTIYSKGGPRNRTETKSVEIVQKGTQLSGHFKGPNQSGGIQGTVNGHHIVFHTKTRNVLNFRGMVDGDSIKGTWGIHGVPGEWEARRTQ